MRKARRGSIAGIVALSVLATGYSVVASLRGLPVNPALLLVYSVAWFFLLALWVVADSRVRRDVYRPYEYGFLAFVFGPVYVPYYLLITRHWRGAAMTLAFAGLYLAPVAVMWGRP